MADAAAAGAPARLVLASASPRRALILTQLGIPFRVAVSDVDETPRVGEDGSGLALRLASAKAAAVARHEDLPVLAGDTVVVLGERILNKPESAAHAAEMLRQLSGRTHEVVTALCLRVGEREHAGVERTAVAFALLSEREIEWYVRTGEPLDKAGGYHIDGRGALFVTAVAGSPSNVAGLPVRLLLTLARQAGVDLGVGFV
jgi:septum formation protein